MCEYRFAPPGEALASVDPHVRSHGQMTQPSYYSDRVQGPRPRVEHDLTASSWGGLVALVESRLASQYFAEDFPTLCDDGPWPIGCDVRAFRLAMTAELPDIVWPLREDQPPPALVAFDLVEFLYEHVSEPKAIVHHTYFGHYHLSFNRARGRRKLRDQVNRIFARNGLAYELDGEGRVERLSTPVLEKQIGRRLPPTGDRELDDLLEKAAHKFADPDPNVRREAVEHAWDAFERAKTVLHADKRQGAAALVSAVGGSVAEQHVLETEMLALTKIGNDFRIRHHETTKAELTDPLIDYFFSRMFALLYRLLGPLSEVGSDE